MSELKSQESSPETSEETKPPSFEELPEWFRQEIIDNNVRRHVDRESVDSVEKHFSFILVAGAALANALIVSGTVPLGFYGLLGIALAGGFSAHLIHKLEASEPLGALIAGACCLPVIFLFAKVEGFEGIDALPFFSACTWLVMSGPLISIVVARERSWRLPF